MSTTKKLVMGRRAMLRGSLMGIGATLALPTLEVMLNTNGTAFAGGEPMPLRFGTFFWGNGVRPDQWRLPETVGAEWWLTPSDALRPIADSAVHHSVSVIRNFGCVQRVGSTHHFSRAQMLTGSYDPLDGRYGNPTGPSADYVLARAWAESGTTVASLDVGISEYGKSLSRERSGCSHDASGERLPAEFSARNLFDRLFGGSVPDGDPMLGEALRSSRRSVLDVVSRDAMRLRARVGTADRARLDQHLDGLADIQREIAGMASPTTRAVPERPDAEYGDDPNAERLVEKNDIVARILATALACDITRVFTVQFTGAQSDCVFWQVDARQGSHVMTHDDRDDVPSGDRLDPQHETVQRVVVFTMQRFVTLLEALEGMTEGDSTVLHNSAIYATSEVDDGTTHSVGNMPILVAGRAGGRLVAGRHVVGDQDNAARVPFTLMHALGHEAESFGAGESQATETISELLT